jgi:integrase
MRRRGANEGSIFRRKSDGLWTGSLTTGHDENGRRRRHVVYGRTKREVLERLEELRARRREGRLAEPSSLTVGGWLRLWLDRREDLRLLTRTEYERLIRHALPHLGGRRLQALEPVHLEQLQARLRAEGVGAHTRRALHRLLHKALDDAASPGLRLLAANPAARVTAPAVEENEVKILAPEEVARLLEAAAGDPRVDALVALLATTGMRLSEALGLAWRHVDLRARTVRVERKLTESNRRREDCVTLEGLEAAYRALREAAEPSVPRADLERYGEALDENLRALLAAVRGGRWRALRRRSEKRGTGKPAPRAPLSPVEARLVAEASREVPRFVFEPPKTRQGRRTVELPQVTIAALERHRARLGAVPHPERLVFTAADGAPWRRSNLIRRHWQPLLERAGLPGVGLHALRHSHVSALLEAGANVVEVAARVGHRRASFTLDAYAHRLDRGRGLAERVDALLAGGR